MSRELILLRHAKSDWDVQCDDFNRPLKKRGRKAAKVVGEWLLHQELFPESIISSPATRALQTLHIVLDILKIERAKIIQDESVYLADVGSLLSVLSSFHQHAASNLLVGHNPGLEDLLQYLLGENLQSEDGKILTTAALARLSMPDRWIDLEPGCAKVITLLRPSQMKP